MTVEAGVTYIVVSNALKERGLQFHVTTEIGNVTLGAMATAATKDSSFPGGYGQISSYVTAVRLVTPDGKLREITERDNPEEMQIIRSSYGLFGIVYEVTIKVRPTTALAVRHYSLSLDNFRKLLPDLQGARLCGDVLHLPLCEARAGRAAQGQSRRSQPTSRYRWVYRNRFWRKYGPAVTLWIQRSTKNHSSARARRQAAFLPAAPGAGVAWCAATAPGRTPRSSTIRATPAPTNICSACGRSAKAASSTSSRNIANFCLAYEKATGYRCDLPSVGYAITRDVEALLSYSWEGATLSIDPASTGGPEWEEFLRHYNEFCSARRGVPLFNQTPFLTRDQVRKAFGVRLQQFAARRKAADPKNRMLDSYFRDLLTSRRNHSSCRADPGIQQGLPQM